MPDEPEMRTYTPGEVAALFRVHVRTVSRWAERHRDRVPHFKTLGGQRRYNADAIDAMIAEGMERPRD